MMNWKTEADIRAEKAKNAPPPKMDAVRKHELDAILQRLDSVAPSSRCARMPCR